MFAAAAKESNSRALVHIVVDLTAVRRQLVAPSGPEVTLISAAIRQRDRKANGAVSRQTYVPNTTVWHCAGQSTGDGDQGELCGRKEQRSIA